MAASSRQKPIPLPKQYSQELIRSDGSHIQVYIDETKRRVETRGPHLNSVVISRPDLGVMYTLNEDARTYCEVPLTGEMLTALGDDLEADMEWEWVREDTIDGKQVGKFVAFRKGRAEPAARFTVDMRTNLRLRTETINKLGKTVLIIESRQADIGPPPHEVFDVPASYIRQDI